MTAKAQPTATPEIDAAAAQAILDAQAKQRVEACGAEIAAVLKRHSCVLAPVVHLAQGSVETEIRIVPQG